MASGQRGANGHPGGSVATDGGAPGIGTRLGGAFRHVADRRPVRCAPRRQWGSNVHGTNPAGRVCLLLHVSPVDEGHADGPVANLQVARETRLTPTAASCPARRRCLPRTSRGRAVRARDREVPLRYSSPMWTGSVPAARHSTSRPTPVATAARRVRPGRRPQHTCRRRRHRCRCLPGDERGNPHLGENTGFKDDRVGRSLAISGAARQANHRTQTACAGTLPGHSAGRPCATAMSQHVGAVVHGAGEVAAVPGRLAMALRPMTQRMARQ
jgi:hypothetical protein